jgi:hypothetical protein
MKWTPWLFGAAMMIAGCAGERRSDDAGAVGDAAETGTMQDTGTPTDTALPGSDTAGPEATTGTAPADTGSGGARLRSDTSKPGTSAGAGDTTGTGTTPPDTARRVHDSTAGTSH